MKASDLAAARTRHEWCKADGVSHDSHDLLTHIDETIKKIEQLNGYEVDDPNLYTDGTLVNRQAVLDLLQGYS